MDTLLSLQKGMAATETIVSVALESLILRSAVLLS